MKKHFARNLDCLGLFCPHMVLPILQVLSKNPRGSGNVQHSSLGKKMQNILMF